MPVETRSLRDRYTVGRFPSVTLGFGEDTEEDKEESEEEEEETENACRQWLRKVCPCCYPKPKDGDITDTVVTVDDDKDEDANDGKSPESSDNELDGKEHRGGLAVL